MKKSIAALAWLIAVLTFVGCSSDKALNEADIVGKWCCELYGSELIIEFTPDSRFISHTDGSENRYTVENGCIVTYVEGDVNSELAIEASVEGDILIYGGVEYERVDN